MLVDKWYEAQGFHEKGKSIPLIVISKVFSVKLTIFDAEYKDGQNTTGC